MNFSYKAKNKSLVPKRLVFLLPVLISISIVPCALSILLAYLFDVIVVTWLTNAVTVTQLISVVGDTVDYTKVIFTGTGSKNIRFTITTGLALI